VISSSHNFWFEKLTVAQLVNEFPPFMEPENSLLISPEMAIGAYPRALDFSSQFHAPFL
jgi:hypothetical protein